ncbi:hypothetical protein SAMN02745206_02800 [Desulfacinum infernum DSM 9756]|uniref:Uncharacterized protein n=1 Tax=Desulfacinum infernum DSM 9756 TaxID=1121391 RepID=A0A1M5F5D8_9BACT|nr:hypothetical protein [Desulfacinum infernum]SHF86727.1 hypothetical protein SAMN02745206_02800 [Desulfacinum infernum DSM 9756]
MIRNKKAFVQGALLNVSFFVVLAVMFSPLFGGENAFHASDRLFNTISKGSTYYIPGLQEKAKEWEGKEVNLEISLTPDRLADNAVKVLMTAGVMVGREEQALKIRGDFGKILSAALADSDAMYHNRGEEVSSRYGIPEKEALFAWWSAFMQMDKALKEQKEFKAAKFLQEVVAKGVEVGYNYYGIAPESAKSKAGILTFALVFYVIYTLWFGYAILLLFDGFGLEMKKGAKKEV